MADLNKVKEAEFITELVAWHTTIVWRNEHGTAELNGDDFFVMESDKWLTLYHEKIDKKESRSHVHLRRGQYRYAEVTEDSGYTPFIAFWCHKDKSDAIGDESSASFAIYFPTFYHWHNKGGKEGKTTVFENQQFYKDWIAKNGRQFEIVK